MIVDTGKPAEHRVARAVTEAFAPAVWAAAMPVVVGLHAGAPWWGLVTVLFTAAVPYGVIWLGVRRGRLTDHHIGKREQRRAPLAIGLASVLAGLGLLVVADAPGELVAMVVVMLLVLLGTTLVNLRWKLSAHTAVSAGAVTALTVLFGPLLAAGALLVAVIGWSRVRLGDHTAAQTVAGAVLGAAIAAAVFMPLAR
ncbi:phosphatase PAP2 family protein [Dactylosporangium sucinum]|uniref:Phosphatidic acid phosphatase type 2/haloperoxidase domain-containing protein n=1 Tax=Dactylosporangium sucinum TaxID=1424081 RepID=A0A917WU83_9ACTN|nr:phosphatase PAP2 family protein [Dactylosporangium sucinum]GGM29136.1 hypothetical protein GCM10007977_033020 [Dactylosporangium sucinum]